MKKNIIVVLSLFFNFFACKQVETKDQANIFHYDTTEDSECQNLTRNRPGAECYRIPFSLATAKDKAELLLKIDDDIRYEIENVKRQARMQLLSLNQKISESGSKATKVQMKFDFEADEINPISRVPKTIEYIRSRAKELIVTSASKLSSGNCFPNEYNPEEFHDKLNRFDILAKAKNYGCLFSLPSVFAFKIRGFVQFGQGLNMQAYVDFLASFMPYVLVVVVDNEIVDRKYRSERKLAIDLGSALGIGSSAALGLSVVAGLGHGLIRGVDQLPAIKLGLGTSAGAGPFGLTLRGYLNFNPPNKLIFRTINDFLDITPPSNARVPFVFYEASANVRVGYAASADIYFSYTLPIDQLAHKLAELIRKRSSE